MTSFLVWQRSKMEREFSPIIVKQINVVLLRLWKRREPLWTYLCLNNNLYLSSTWAFHFSWTGKPSFLGDIWVWNNKNLGLIHINKKPDVKSGFRSCPTKIRTWTNRTKTCCAAITPLDSVVFYDGTKVILYLNITKKNRYILWFFDIPFTTVNESEHTEIVG